MEEIVVCAQCAPPRAKGPKFEDWMIMFPVAMVDPLLDYYVFDHIDNAYLRKAAEIGTAIVGPGKVIKGTKGVINIAGRGVKHILERDAAKATARTAARTLAEKLTMGEAMAGAGRRIMQGRINDPSYPEAIWAKMEHVHMNPDGTNIVIHYWQNLQTGLREGFKFK